MGCNLWIWIPQRSNSMRKVMINYLGHPIFRHIYMCVYIWLHIYEYMCVYIYVYILITIWLHATTHSLVRLKPALFHCEWVALIMLDAWDWGTRWTQGSRHPVASFPKNTLVKSSSCLGKLKLGYCKFAIFLGQFFGTQLLRTLFLVCKKNGALALTVKKLRVCMCVIFPFCDNKYLLQEIIVCPLPFNLE